jgi:Secretion system C-terminal sorting domain
MSFTQRKISLVYSLVTAGILLPMSLFLIVNKGDQPSDKSRQRPADDPKFDVVALALNEVAETGRGLSLSHPNYKWLFTSTSLEMTPTSGAPSWTWTGHEANAFPRYVENKIIYERENLNEEYIIGRTSIEQQFVISRPPVGNRGIQIKASITSSGVFTKSKKGWSWKNELGEVTLSNAFAYDANHIAIPVSMNVLKDQAVIEINSADLDGVAFPVTIDPEIGTNDFRISTMGSDGDPSYAGVDPAVAYNKAAGRYLVVWEGSVAGEQEIYGQLLDGATGAKIGSAFQLSDMGPSGDPNYDANDPDVASSGSEFLVVWHGDDAFDDAFEIYGQRISTTGAQVGPDDFRISDMGTADANINFAATSASVVYSRTQKQYLVTWAGDDDTAPLVDDEFEIYVQRLDSTGTEIGVDVKISDMGGLDGNANYGAFNPDVAWDGVAHQYIVVWRGDDSILPLVDNEFEIFLQRLDETNGGQIGSNDLRISDMGVDGATTAAAGPPSIAYNKINNNFLVAWYGDDAAGGTVDNENEIYGQLISNLGAETGTNDFRISDMGPDGNANYDALNPSVSFDPFLNEYFVNWQGDDNTSGLIDNEVEIFGQILTAAGAETGTNDFRLSDVGGTGNILYNAADAALVYNETFREFLNVWEADDNDAGTVDGEFEVFGQRYAELKTSPTAQPTTPISSLITTTSFKVNFTAATGSPDGYIFLRKSGSSSTDIPINQTVYVAGDVIGSSTVAYVGSLLTFNESVLTAGTSYFYDAISYNGAYSSTNYFTTLPLEFTVATLASEPTTQVSALGFSAVTTTSVTIGFTNGNGTSRLLVGKSGATIDVFPTDGNSYTANNSFGTLATDLGSSNFVVASGSAPVTVTGLSPATVYFFRGFESNGSAGQSNYYTATATNNPLSFSTLSLQPTAQPTAPVPSLITSSSFKVNFSAAAGTPDGYIVLRKSGVSPTDIPADQSVYTIGNTIGSSTVAYVGSTLNFTESGLAANTGYFYDVFSYNGTSTTTNYLATSPLEFSVTTLTAEPSTQLSNFTFTSIGTNSVSVGYTNGNGASRLIVAKSGSAVDVFPTDGNGYTANNVFGTAGANLGSSNYVVGSGTGPFTVTGLSPATVYNVRGFESNGSTSLSNYNANPATNNPSSFSTLSLEPGFQPTSILFSSITNSSMTVGFTPASGSPTGYIAILKSGSAPIVPADLPIDGTTYAAGNSIGGSIVAYVGSTASFSQSSLTAGTNYFYIILAYNGSGTNTNYYTTSPLGGNVFTLANDPIAQPTSLTITAPTTTALTIGFTAASGSPSGYLVLRKAGTAPAEVPVDATAYTAGGTIGTSTIAYVGATAGFTDAGLTANTVYNYAVFSFNGSATTLNYFTSSPLTGNRTTLELQPANQPTVISFSAVTSTSMNVSFTAATGSPAGYLVLRKGGSAPAELPVDGTAYTAGSVIGTSTVAFVGSTTSLSATSLPSGIIQYYTVYSYNGSGAAINYLTTTPLSGNQQTTLVEPTNQATGLTFSTITTSSMDGNFTAASGSPAGYLVLRKAGASPTEVPVDGTSYTVGNALGSSSIVSISSTSTFTNTGLSPNTVYYYAVFSYNGSGVTFNYLTTSPLLGNQTTLALEPTAQPTGLGFSSITTTAMTVSFTAAGTPDGHVVLRKSGSPPTENPADGIAYTVGSSLGTSIVVTAGSPISFASTGLTAGTTYYYAAFAYNGSGQSTNYFTSTPLTNSKITLSDAPVVPTDITDKSSTFFKASWSASVGAASYVLDISTATDFSSFVTGYSGKPITGLDESVEGLTSATTYFYRVRAVNESGESANSVKVIVRTNDLATGITQLSISAGPTFTNSPTTTISITLKDGSGAKVVKFFSRGILATDFSQIDLTSTSNIYETIVTSAMLDDMGLEFYFTAADATTTSAIKTTNAYIYKPISANEKSIQGLSAGGQLQNYRIISIPYKLDDNLVLSIFGASLGEYDDTKWRLIHYLSGKNQDFPKFNRIDQGVGYWFNSIAAADIKLGKGTVPQFNQQSAFKLNLSKGWNQIGDPYPFDVDWDDVVGANPGKSVGNLIVFNPSSTLLAESNSLKVWSGGFVFVDDDVNDFSFPVTLKNTAGGRIANGEIPGSDLSGSVWLVPLTLQKGSGENKMIGVGMHPNASNSKDQFDAVTIPRFFNYLEMSVHHAEFFYPEFTRDIVQTTNQYSWDFLASSNLGGIDASLSWNPETFGTNNAQLFLYDESSQSFINMRLSNHYSFDLSKDHHFRILFSADGHDLNPELTMIGKPYPNPAAGKVTIPMILREDGYAVVEVLDLNGKKVKTIARDQFVKGVHELSWQGEDDSATAVPSGVYLIQLKTENSFRQVQKVIINK